MYSFLTKKVGIPGGVRLGGVAWNGTDGWIAVGGDGGLVKVLKLEAGANSASAPSSLAVNQSLETHRARVTCLVWNEQFQKLTTSDEDGMIVVWMVFKGVWYEEMVNNRNKSLVAAMKWASDGQRIAIAYRDGMVIVGSVDGNRIWGRELGMNLAVVEWSADGRALLFGTAEGRVHVYDHTGTAMHPVQLYCLEGIRSAATVVGIEWYRGAQARTDGEIPCLALAFDCGRMQIMRSQHDDRPALIDTGMHIASICWNPQGSTLAVVGTTRVASGASGEERDVNMVQFYTPAGNHLRSLRVPGTLLSGASWDGSGLRMALAVDAFVYFASVRPDYKWAFFAHTVVYVYAKPDRVEHCVVFWDTKTDEKYVKYVKRLVSIRACGEHCVLVTRTEDPSQFLLILCNAIGTPVDSKYVEVEPSFTAMTKFHVIVASDELVYVWQYSTALAKLTSVEPSSGAAAIKSKSSREKTFHVDDLPSSDAVLLRRGEKRTADSICCVCASDTTLVVARESGTLQRYGLPHLSLDGKNTLRCRPDRMLLNCTSSKISIIDINGVLTFFDLQKRPEGSGPTAPLGCHLVFERKDVWDMLWSDDDAEQFAMLEKGKMQVMRGLDAEEPVNSTAFLCRFHNLKIKAVNLDELMVQPDKPKLAHFVKFETSSLKETTAKLTDAPMLEVMEFVEQRSHPRLWRMVAESALRRLDFGVANKSFVKCHDYYGVQFVKKLKRLDSKLMQRAEVEAHFKNFDEAEALYTQCGRTDLALKMRVSTGNWERVLALAESGMADDALKQTALNELGDFHADRQQWLAAANYYMKSGNVHRLIECQFMLEDFAALERSMHLLPDRDPLLLSIGEKFAVVGIHEHAVTAYLRGGDVKAAVDACVALNQWSDAVQLAEKYNLQSIEGLLSQYANHLLDKGERVAAVELFRKAGHHLDSAQLLLEIGKEAGANKLMPLLAKQFCVLSALEVETHRKTALSSQLNKGFAGGGGGGSNALQSLMQVDSASAAGGAQPLHRKKERLLDRPWHAAEAFHFFLLAQRQLYESMFDAALQTALLLRDYEDVLEGRAIYSLIALTAYYAGQYGQCSKAMIVLEASEELPQALRTTLEETSLQIFTRHRPVDAAPLKAKRVTHALDALQAGGDKPGGMEAICVATGQVIAASAGAIKCSRCKHRVLDEVASSLKTCPLCHAKM